MTSTKAHTLPASVLAEKAAAQHDAFLDSPNLDPDWIEGWQAAVKHTAAVIALIKDDATGDAGCPVATALSHYDAYPTPGVRGRAWVAGWHSAVNQIAYVLRDYADHSDWNF